MKCNQITEKLTAYLLGDLDEATSNEVRAHLETCDGCRAVMQEIEPTLGILRDALAVTRKEEAPGRLSAEHRIRVFDSVLPEQRSVFGWLTEGHPRLAMAAVVVAVLGFFGLLLGSLMPARQYARESAGLGKSLSMMEDSDGDERIHRERTQGTQGWLGGDSDKAGGGREEARGSRRGGEKRLSAGIVAGYDQSDQSDQSDPTDQSDRTDSPAPPAQPATEVAVYDRKTAPGGPKGEAPLPSGGQSVLSAPSPVRMKGLHTSRSARESELAKETRRALKPKKSEPGATWGVAGKDNAAEDSLGKLTLERLEEAPEYDSKAGEVVASESFVSAVDEISARNEVGNVAGYARDSLTRGAGSRSPQSGEPENRDFETDEAFGLHDKREDTKLGSGLVKVLDRLVSDSDLSTMDRELRELPERDEEKHDDIEDLSGQVNDSDGDESVNGRDKDEEKEEYEASAAEALEYTKIGARFKAYGVNPFYAAAARPFSTFSIDVDTAAYTLSRNYMMRGLLPPAEAVRTEEFVNFFDYDYKPPSRGTFGIHVEGAPSRFGRGLHLLKIGVKGRRLGREEQRPAVLTFLVDTSGSMDQPDRIGLVRKSLKMLIDRLGEHDSVAIVQYDSRARLVIEHTSVSQKKQLLAAIDAMQCGGSTNLEEGMALAYAMAGRKFVGGAENRVLLLSDGVANLGTSAADEILAKVETYRKQGVHCSVFGFGIGTYDDEMLESLANKGDGAYTFIDSEEEARRVFVDDLAATLNTIASDVKIQVEFMTAGVKRYRQLGYENRQLRKQDFRDDTVDAGEVGSGQSVTALYELELDDDAEARKQPLAIVRIRYRRTDTGAVEEVTQPVTMKAFVSSFDESDTRFRLGACAAEFAEILRGSEFAAGSEYSDVAAVLAPVALDLGLDGRVQEFLRMVQSAGSMARAAE